MTTKFTRLIHQVQATQPMEINCSQCLALVSQYVDLEIHHKDASAHLPLVKQHLTQCKVCREEYEVLHDMAVLEQEGQLPDTDDLKNRL